MAKATPNAEGKSVGEYVGIVPAGAALYEATVAAMERYDRGEHDEALSDVRAALARVDTGVPSRGLVSKRELWVLHEALGEHVGDQFHAAFDLEGFRAKRGYANGPRTFREVRAQSFATGVAPGSFRDGMTMGPPFAIAAEAFLERAALELVSNATTVLRHPVLTTVARRAAALMDALPAGENDIHTRLEGESPAGPETDIRFVLRAMRGGLRTGAIIGISSLAPLPEYEATRAKDATKAGETAIEKPNLTAAKVIRTARMSRALVRTPASLNGAETRAFARELPDNEFRRNPDLWERGAGDHSVRYVKDLRQRIAEARRANGDDPTSDQFGLVRATLGCPALKEIRGEHDIAGLARLIPSQLMRMHAVAIAAMEHHWKLTLPSRPPLDLGALGIPDDRHYGRIVLTDLPGVSVRTLPSDSGLLHVVASNDALAAGLRIERDGDTLRVDGAGRDGQRRLSLTIHTPFPSGIEASGVPYLDLEHCDRVTAAAVPGGIVRACLFAGREYAAASLGALPSLPAPDATRPAPIRHRVDSAPGASILIYSDLAGAAELNRAREDSLVLVSDYDWQPFETVASDVDHVSMDSVTAETLRALPAAAREILRRNEPWLGRHAYGRRYEVRQIGDLLRSDRRGPRRRRPLPTAGQARAATARSR